MQNDMSEGLCTDVKVGEAVTGTLLGLELWPTEKWQVFLEAQAVPKKSLSASQLATAWMDL